MRKISSFSLAFAFILPLAGCPGDDSGDDGSTPTATATETATATATESASASATESASDTDSASATESASATDMTDSADSGTATESESESESESETGGAGFCAGTCEAPEDCGDPAEDFECNNGFCEFVGEVPDCDPATCDDIGIGACAEVDGVSTCTTPCTDGGGECDLLMAECTGMDDGGNMICEFPPCLGAGEGEACEIEGFGSFGTCTDGECTCETDEECTVPDFACNN